MHTTCMVLETSGPTPCENSYIMLVVFFNDYSIEYTFHRIDSPNKGVDSDQLSLYSAHSMLSIYSEIGTSRHETVRFKTCFTRHNYGTVIV